MTEIVIRRAAPSATGNNHPTRRIMSNVTFLGLGAMGSRMAANLIKAGHVVTVWNRSPDAAKPLAAAGGKQAATPKAAAEGADFVISMVRDDEASRELWLAPETGALAGV